MIKPTSDRLVVEPFKTEEKTENGIIIPQSAQEKMTKGTVVSVGKDVCEVKEGDTVLYGKYAGTEVDIDGKKLLLMKENDVIAIFSE